MTPEQLKELVEFATEFLPWLDNIDEQKLFHDGTYSPILMHLAQEKLEKEGFEWILFTLEGNVGYKMNIFYLEKGWYAEHENKFIAFWEATRQAKGRK